MSAPNTTAPGIGHGRNAGGVSAAGASVQNAVAPSPEKNEQFLPHSPRGSHHAMNFQGPLNSVTITGRGRPSDS